MHLVLAFLFVVAATGFAAAQDSKKSEELLRQRLLLQERFNKGYDVQIENANDRIEGRCKGEAKKRFSAIHPIKRRKYQKECIERARAAELARERR